MAVSASALNMAQYAILSNDPVIEAVTFSLIDNGSVMARDIPFANKKSLIAAGVRWEGNLPSVTWANANEEGTTVSGTPTPFQEQVYILRNNIDTDKVYVEDVNQIVNPRSAQLAAYLKSQAYDFNHKFIKNDHVAGDAKAFVGLRYRIDNGSTYGVRSGNKIDGGAVDLTQAAATAATFGNFLELVDQLLWSVDSPEGDGVVLYVNDVLKRRWSNLAARFAGQGGLGQATDQMGRSVATYKNAQIRDIGYKADQSTRIITVTETANGATDTGSTHTSMYAANFGEEHLMGWQYEALQARDLGLMENGVIYRTFIDWSGGLINMSNRSIGRLHGIKLS